MVAIGLTLFSALGLLLTSFILASSGRRLRDGEQALDREAMKKICAFWMIYCNPDDPRGWVPKITGPGWTVNARTRGGAFVMMLFTIGTVVGVVLTLVTAFGNFASLRP